MKDDHQWRAELAASMDASVELLSLLPELFSDLEDLGARERDVLAVLAVIELPDRARVLDLGCGKGSALISLAQRHGIEGLGVDGFAPFLEHAKARSMALGLGERLSFERTDVREVVDRTGDYDLVMLLALGPVFGDASETIAALRRCVVPGGYMLLDEAYLPDDLDSEDPHWQIGLSLDELVGALSDHGDELVAEVVYDTPEYGAWCGEMSDKIQERAAALAERTPELAQELTDFAQRQSEETQATESPFVGSLFLLRRTSD
jgi:cyclopropane fatty-acyl-phospholipid synthase-like methyltransferase